MILYLAIIAAAYAAITIINAVTGMGFGGAAGYTAAAVGAVAAVDVVCALLTRWCIPEKKMNPFCRCFAVSVNERRIYERLGIRKWKDVIPESGKYLVGFAKDKIARPNDNEYLLKFLRETCYAEIMHVASFFCGFLTLLFMPFAVKIVLPAAAVNAFLQLLPVLVQRYNRGRMIILYRFNERRGAKVENC